MRRFIIIIAIIFSSNYAYSADVWLNQSGSDTSPYDTKAKGANSWAKVLVVATTSDTIIFADGTYTSDDYKINDIPDGTAENYTTVRAETTFGVIFSGMSNGTGFTECIISIYNDQYVEVTGFIIKDSTASNSNALSSIQVKDSNYIKVRKIGIKNGTGPITDYAGPVSTGSTTYSLFEDIFLVGQMRYGLNIGGGVVSHHNIARRVVVRWDYNNQDQPRGAIAIYGGNEGETPNNNILLQNCIVIDGNDGEGATFTGGFLSPHETSFITWDSCISLNQEGFGVHASQNSLCHDNKVVNSVVWGTSNDGVYFDNLTTGTSGVYNLTLNTGVVNAATRTGGAVTETLDSIFLGTSTNGMTTIDGNIFYPAVASMGTNYSTDDPDLQYIIESTVSGKGATILKQMGKTGTLWGETGYDLAQDGTSGQDDIGIWPFPNEDEIKTLFSETNNPPGGYDLVPATNDTTRGFCADIVNPRTPTGKITFSSYIAEYLGNTALTVEMYGTPVSVGTGGGTGSKY